jgi:glycosyltransferase involved in cell wall biosynthesis
MIPNARQDIRSGSWICFSGLFATDDDSNAHWIRECGVIALPPAARAGTVRIRGEFAPVSPQDITVRGPVGLAVSLNAKPVWKNTAMPQGPFEVSFELPEGEASGFSTIELRILGVRLSNFFAWLGRVTKSLPLPHSIRGPLQRFRRQPKNRQLLITGFSIGDNTIFDFTDPHMPYRHAAARPWFKLGINVVGFHLADLGVGQSARCMVKACDAVAMPVAVVPLKLNCKNPHSDDTLASRLTTKNPHPVNVVHIDAPQSPEIGHHHGPSFLSGKYNIGYWAWELPEFPDAWVQHARCFDEIWTPSNFVRDAIAPKVRQSVHTMPHAIEFARPSGSFRAKFGLPEKKFLFLFIYDLNSYSERKNPRAALAAWRQAFGGREDTGIVIKVQNKADNHGDWMRLHDEIAGIPGAILLSETMKRSEVYELQSACDCFVSLHRSEGFGLSVAECMYLGKPVISTDWSATAEFVNGENGCPARYKLVTIERSVGPYAKGQIWADPDVDHAASLMKQLASDPQLCARLGAAARRTIEERFSPVVIGRRYRRRLDAIAAWHG